MAGNRHVGKRARSAPDDAGRPWADSSRPKYSIAVASDLSGVPQQQLRRMEEGGLVAPGRSDGNTRRYSDDDLTLIAEVAQLADAGVNAVGIRHILALRAELVAARAEIAVLRQRLTAAKGSDSGTPD